MALARSHATRMGVLDDTHAEGMLAQPWRTLGRGMRHRPLRRLGTTRSFAYLAARTLYFDAAVSAALDAGIRQVVVVGAGYDSRSWRLSRPGVRFIEVDHPATQADKRRRAPSGGPTYVPAVLGHDHLATALGDAGLDPRAATLFTVEGLSMYLDEASVADLLTDLADLGATGSRLVVNFGVGFDRSESAIGRALALPGRALVAMGRERFRFEPSPAEAAALVTRSGWAIDQVLSGPDLSERHLVDTPFAHLQLNPRSTAISASTT